MLIKVWTLRVNVSEEELPIEKFFTEDTISVHLKAGAPPMAKRGYITEVKFEKVEEEILTEQQVKEWAGAIEDSGRESDKGFFEFDEKNMKIIQLRNYRITIGGK